MTFTDDDLKWLKEALSYPDDWKFIESDCGHLKALLARLEAAEAFAEQMQWSTHSEDDRRLLSTWRTAAGK